MISENAAPNTFSVWHGWGDWTLRTLLVLGLSFVIKTLTEVKPWQGVIVGYSTAQAEDVPEESPLDESMMAPRFKTTPKPWRPR